MYLTEFAVNRIWILILNPIPLMCQGLESLVDRLLSSGKTELVELLPPLVGNCLGYFRSQNPMLRYLRYLHSH